MELATSTSVSEFWFVAVPPRSKPLEKGAQSAPVHPVRPLLSGSTLKLGVVLGLHPELSSDSSGWNWTWGNTDLPFPHFDMDRRALMGNAFPGLGVSDGRGCSSSLGSVGSSPGQELLSQGCSKPAALVSSHLIPAGSWGTTFPQLWGTRR